MILDNFISNIVIRSDYETALSIQSEMNIFVPKLDRIGFGSDLHTSSTHTIIS